MSKVKLVGRRMKPGGVLVYSCVSSSSSVVWSSDGPRGKFVLVRRRPRRSVCDFVVVVIFTGVYVPLAGTAGGAGAVHCTRHLLVDALFVQVVVVMVEVVA